jgi:ribosomal protein L20
MWITGFSFGVKAIGLRYDMILQMLAKASIRLFFTGLGQTLL